MSKKNIISITEARKRIFEISNEVQKPGVYYILTDKGRAKAVIMSIEEFESWQETIEVYQDFPDLEKDIKEAERDYLKGDYVTLEQILAEQGFVLADKSKKKYAVSGNRFEKSKKRNK